MDAHPVARHLFPTALNRVQVEAGYDGGDGVEYPLVGLDPPLAGAPPLMIDAGIDVVQTSARGMEIENVRCLYSGDVCLHGPFTRRRQSNWRQFCKAVRECVTADPDLGGSRCRARQLRA